MINSEKIRMTGKIITEGGIFFKRLSHRCDNCPGAEIISAPAQSMSALNPVFSPEVIKWI
jgi:hypothetical protein